MTTKKADTKFDVNIYPDAKGSGLNIKELRQYRDMIKLMVRRDFVADYKQTVLGPAWAVIQPVISTLVMMFVFGNLAGFSPEGVPSFLFYMISQFSWDFFAGCLDRAANTFTNGQWLMRKIYFPRLAFTISSVISRIVALIINIVMFMIICVIYSAMGMGVTPNATALLLPLYYIHLAAIAIGVGTLLSSMTTKYKDTVMLIGYGAQLWMFLSPVVYDIASVPEAIRPLYMINPVAPVITQIRYAVFGLGEPVWGYYLLSIVITAVLLMLGSKVFSIVERNFIDTI